MADEQNIITRTNSKRGKNGKEKEQSAAESISSIGEYSTPP